MPSLWGLLEERWDLGSLNTGPGERYSGLFRTALPAALLAEVDRLWGTEMLPQWPDKVVSAMSPHFALAEAFGPALKFWNSVALTAWFVCEGPMSRTSIANMELYFRRDLEALDTLGTPIDRSMFRDLIEVHQSLVALPPEPLSRSLVEVAEGISFELTFSFGPDRLEGFSELRDVITRHRRTWADRHLDDYLRERPEAEVDGAVSVFAQMRANKPPAITPFARKVSAIVNQWFGGDISALYDAMDEECPVTVTRPPRVLPDDRFMFVEALIAVLRVAFRPAVFADGESGQWAVNGGLTALARLGVRVLQMSEALGRVPTLKEVGQKQFEQAQWIRVGHQPPGGVAALDDDPASAFGLFTNAVYAALGAD